MLQTTDQHMQKHIQKHKVKHQEFSAATAYWRAGHYKFIHPGAEQLSPGGPRGAGAPLVLKNHQTNHQTYHQQK